MLRPAVPTLDSPTPDGKEELGVLMSVMAIPPLFAHSQTNPTLSLLCSKLIVRLPGAESSPAHNGMAKWMPGCCS